MVYRFFIVLFIFPILANAYRPSIDVLFKNNGNPIYNGETTSADIQIKEMSSQTTFKLKIQIARFQKQEYLLQALFDQSLNPTDIIHFSRVQDFNGKALARSQNTLVHVFYGLLDMYLSNNNTVLVEGLDKLGIKITKSQNTINVEQEKLLQRYLYFVRRKAKGTISENENPLRSSDPSKQAVINNILKEPYYQNTEKATLIRQNQRFFWSIERKDLKALFDQQSRKLVSMELPDHNRLTIIPEDALIFSGYYSVPKRLMVYEGGVIKYEISFVQVSNFKDSLDAFQSRAALWQQTAATQNKEKKAILNQFPSFVLH